MMIIIQFVASAGQRKDKERTTEGQREDKNRTKKGQRRDKKRTKLIREIRERKEIITLYPLNSILFRKNLKLLEELP